MTNTLLLISIATTVVFLGVVIVEVTLRPNDSPACHMVSALSLSDQGWVQVANFLQMGIGMLALAVAINQTLDTVVASVLVAAFGAGAIASGLFNMDPSFRYPPGAPGRGRHRPDSLHSRRLPEERRQDRPDPAGHDLRVLVLDCPLGLHLL